MRFTILLTTTTTNIVTTKCGSIGFAILDGRYNLTSLIAAGHENFNKECSCSIGECRCVGFGIYDGDLGDYRNKCKLLYSFIQPNYNELERDIDLF